MAETVFPSIDARDVAPSVRRDIVTTANTDTKLLPGSGVVTIVGSSGMEASLPAPTPGARLDIRSSGDAAHTVNANSTGTSFTTTGANQLSFAAAPRVAITLIGLTDTAWGIFSTVASSTGGTVTVANQST